MGRCHPCISTWGPVPVSASLLHRPEADEHGGAVEKYTLLLPPPHHCAGGVVRPSWRESRREVPKLTCLRERVQPSASLVLMRREGCTPELPPAPALSTDGGGEGQDKVPPRPCTGHENGVQWSHPCDYAGAPPQADSTGSAQPHGKRWLEPAQRSRMMLAPGWLPASPWLNGGSSGGKHCGVLPELLSDSLLQPWSPAGLEGRPESPSRARRCWDWC